PPPLVRDAVVRCCAPTWSTMPNLGRRIHPGPQPPYFSVSYVVPLVLPSFPPRRSSDPDIELVDLCLPHDLHAPVSIAASRAGKHVFVEKPVANTVAAADAMIAAADEADRLLLVDHPKRSQNRNRTLKALLEAGHIGRPLLVRASYLQDISPAWRAMDERRKRTYWKHDGVISGIGIHSFDLLRWLIGEVEQVQAVSTVSDVVDSARTTEDSALAILTFAEGCIAEVALSYAARGPRTAANWDLMPIEIYGTAGHIVMDTDDRITVFSDALGEPGVGAGTVHRVWNTPAVGEPRPPAEGMAGAIDHVIDCIRDRSITPLTDGAEARRSLAVVEAAYRSIAENRTVTVPS